jgi:DNA polymerase III subunit beta
MPAKRPNRKSAIGNRKSTNPFAEAVTASAKLLAEVAGIPFPDSQPQTQIVDKSKIENMKLTIARSHLAAALAAVRNAALVKADATHPILANVLLVADGKNLTLTTTDLDVSLRTQLAADVNLKGQTTVRAALLADLCKSFKADRLTLTVGDGTPADPSADAATLTVTAGSAKFELATLDAGEFPPFTTPADAQTFELLEHELAALLRRTTFCRSTDSKRPILNGTLIRMDGDTFVAACDGLRLAVEQGAPTTLKADLNLPARATAELLRLLSTDPEKPRKVTVVFNSSQAQFSFGEHLLITKLIEGQYPDYTRIVPTLDDTKIVTVDRPALLSALKRVALIADGVELVFKPKTLHLNSCNSAGEQLGKSAESLLTTGTVEATAKYATTLLIAALEAVDSEEINLYPSANAPIALHDPTSTWLGVIAAMQ